MQVEKLYKESKNGYRWDGCSGGHQASQLDDWLIDVPSEVVRTIDTGQEVQVEW